MLVKLIILIVITFLSFIGLIATFIIQCGIEFLRKIELSSCCGGDIHMTKINDMKKELLNNQSQQKIEIDNIKSILESQTNK
jgi:iron-sulfur cluster repair protein YtfE (RIC family)